MAVNRRRGTLWIALSALSASLVAAIFIAFLLRGAGRSRDLAQSLPAEGRGGVPTGRLPIALDEYPRGSPTDPNPEPLPRYGGDFPRWNLREFPEGWDEALAKTIHTYFERMSVDFRDEERLLEVPAVREEFREFLSKLGPEALPTLAAILNAEGDFVNRRFLLYAIGELGPRSEMATFILRDFYLARHADPRNESEIRHVVNAMAKLQNDTAFEVLKELASSPEPSVDPHRRFFVAALGEHQRREQAVPFFVDHLHADREEAIHVRNMSAQALGKVRSRETLSELYRAAETEPYFAVKQTILGTIGKIGASESIPFLEAQFRQALAPKPDAAYKEESLWIRLSAARALSRIGTADAVEALRELGRIEPDEKGREYIEKWIAEASEEPAN